MFKFLSLLPCLLLAADVSSQSECPQLIECENIIHEDTFFAEDPSLAFFLEVEADTVDYICHRLDNLTDCISRHIDSCSSEVVLKEVRTVHDIFHYMCTPYGRQLILSLSSSQCADNPLLDLQMDTMINGCVETFQFEMQLLAMNAQFSGREFQMSDVCPFIDRLKNCAVSGARHMCGQEMATFVSNIWDIAAEDEFDQFSCTAGLAHRRRYVKRAVPMLLRKSTLVKKLRK